MADRVTLLAERIRDEFNKVRQEMDAGGGGTGGGLNPADYFYGEWVE